jgi:GT2 family glycosyltransferase
MALSENRGFVGGFNIGLREAMARGARYVLLLNNDTVVAPDLLTELLAVAERDEQIAAVGPTIYYHSNPEMVWSAGGELDARHGEGKMIGIGGRGDVFVDRPVDFVTGCALLVRTAALRRVGLLDERFFAYFEEVEWCWRMRQAGFTVWHAPAGRVWHKIAPGPHTVSPHMLYFMTRNRLLFLQLAGMWMAWLHVMFVAYPRTLLSWTLRRRWKDIRHLRRPLWRGLVDYCTGQFGAAPDAF